MANKTAEEILMHLNGRRHRIPEASRQLFEAVMEMIGEDKAKQHVRVEKPGHGRCCTCQICGLPYDECLLNRMLDEDELRADLRAKARAFYGITESEGSGAE